MSKRSEVWNYFKRNDKNRDFAFCKQCNKQLGRKGSSTTPLLNHLKLHKIYLNSSNLSTITSSIELNSQQNEPISKKKRQCVDNGIIQVFDLLIGILDSFLTPLQLSVEVFNHYTMFK